MPNYVTWNRSPLITANTTKDGTGGVVASVFSAQVETYVHRLVFRAAGTNAASVARVFLNNGKDRSIAENNILFAETTLDSTTLSETAAQATEEIELGIWLPPGHQIFVTLGTAGTAGWYITAVVGEWYAQAVIEGGV